jgi:hypothetical protein
MRGFRMPSARWPVAPARQSQQRIGRCDVAAWASTGLLMRELSIPSTAQNAQASAECFFAGTPGA